MKNTGLADSPLFRKPSPPPAPIAQERTPERANTRTGEHTNTRTDEQANGRTPEQVNTRTRERPISRQSYNVFTDQHKSLQQLELQAAIADKKVTISDMVREALDRYLKNANG